MKHVYMTCCEIEQCSNSTVQRKIMKQDESEQGPLKKIEVGAMEE